MDERGRRLCSGDHGAGPHGVEALFFIFKGDLKSA
jgi:hypothetical protein